MLIYALYINVFLLCLSVHVSNIILILKVDILTLLQRIQLIVRRLCKQQLCCLVPSCSLCFIFSMPGANAFLSPSHDFPLFYQLAMIPRSFYLSHDSPGPLLSHSAIIIFLPMVPRCFITFPWCPLFYLFPMIPCSLVSFLLSTIPCTFMSLSKDARVSRVPVVVQTSQSTHRRPA